MRGATLHCRRDANDGGGHGKSMPLLIAFGLFVLIVAPVLLGSRFFGPHSWPIQSDRNEQRRARINSELAEELRQRLRGAMKIEC